MEKVLKKSRKKSSLVDAETGWGGFCDLFLYGMEHDNPFAPLDPQLALTVLKEKEVCQNPCIFLFTESDTISERNDDSNCNRCGKLKTGSRDILVDERYSLCVPLR